MAQLGRPFDPSTGLNRELLLAVRREPGQAPGTLARVLRRDGAVVRDALARLEAYGLIEVTPHPTANRSEVRLTEAGSRVLRRRRTRGSQAVHKAVVNSTPVGH